MFANFGDLGMAIKGLMEQYQEKTKQTANVQSIEDMQRFVESYPEFRQFGTNVEKHVALMGELSRLVEANNLMEVSALEQDLACSDDHSAHRAAVQSSFKCALPPTEVALFSAVRAAASSAWFPRS